MATKMGRPTGPDGARTAVVTVRLTPRVKFGLDMLSRLHRMSVPELLTIAVDDLFGSEIYGLWDDEMEPVEYEKGQFINPRRNLLKVLWAERASDRFANIGLHKIELFDVSEKQLWNTIKSEQKYWSDASLRTDKELLRDVLAEDWPSLKSDFL